MFLASHFDFYCVIVWLRLQGQQLGDIDHGLVLVLRTC